MDVHDLARAFAALWWVQDARWHQGDPEDGFLAVGLAYMEASSQLESHTRAAVEAERAACEAVAREPRMFHASDVADAIAARKGGPK